MLKENGAFNSSIGDESGTSESLNSLEKEIEKNDNDIERNLNEI